MVDKNVNIINPGQQKPLAPPSGLQRDTNQVPIVLPPGEIVQQVPLQSNRLDGATRLDIAADNVLTPDGGALAYLNRFTSTGAVLTTVLSSLAMGGYGAAIAFTVIIPLAGLAWFLNRKEYHKLILLYYLAAAVIGSGMVLYPLARKTNREVLQPSIQRLNEELSNDRL